LLPGFSPRILPRFCFPAGFSPGSPRRSFLDNGENRFFGEILAEIRGGNEKDPAGKTVLILAKIVMLQVGSSNGDDSTTNFTRSSGEFNLKSLKILAGPCQGSFAVFTAVGKNSAKKKKYCSEPYIRYALAKLFWGCQINLASRENQNYFLPISSRLF